MAYGQALVRRPCTEICILKKSRQKLVDTYRFNELLSVLWCCVPRLRTDFVPCVQRYAAWYRPVPNPFVGSLVFLLLPFREDDFINREVNHHLHTAVDDGDENERRQKQRDGKRRKIAPTSIAHLMLAQAQSAPRCIRRRKQQSSWRRRPPCGRWQEPRRSRYRFRCPDSCAC